jgi:hypothetical protein
MCLCEFHKPSLLNAAESISSQELERAPELTTFAALDANLLATTRLIQTNMPYIGNLEEMFLDLPYSINDNIAESILVLAKALRKNLAAYYLVMREKCRQPEYHYPSPDDEVMF